ncbi:MAG: RDD family protein [Clostridia bacterium]|nr:RDD family protein [Clostridia bacterium]
MIYDLQKASMWKRISAFLFDGIMLGVVAVLCAWLLSIATGFDGHYNVLTERYAHYETQYNVSFNMTLSEYEAMTAEELKVLDDAYAALSGDDQAVYAYNMVVQLMLLITTIGIFLSFLLMEFIIPMLFHNGQTLGKKVFGIAVMRTEGIKINGVCLFIRTILGKYTIETMVPVLMILMIVSGTIGIVGPLVIGLIVLLNIIVMIATKTNSAIHDLLANTVTVDLASQMIFDTREDLIAYKQKLHAEKVANSAY